MVRKQSAGSPARNGFNPDFAAIVHEYESMVFSIAYHFTQNAATAEELAQDAFLRLYQNLASITSAQHLKSWLRKTTIHRCIDYARRQKSELWLPLDTVPEPASKQHLPDSLSLELVNTLVASLPEKVRLIVILRFQEELELQEIAQLLEIPLNTVKSRLQRALALLRRKLEGVHAGACL